MYSWFTLNLSLEPKVHFFQHVLLFFSEGNLDCKATLKIITDALSNIGKYGDAKMKYFIHLHIGPELTEKWCCGLNLPVPVTFKCYWNWTFQDNLSYTPYFHCYEDGWRYSLWMIGLTNRTLIGHLGPK